MKPTPEQMEKYVQFELIDDVVVESPMLNVSLTVGGTTTGFGLAEGGSDEASLRESLCSMLAAIVADITGENLP